MGEAKRKATAKAAITNLIIPDDIKHDIAWTVQSVHYPPGGMCWFRAVMGQLVLHSLGLSSDIAVGGMVYRAGPDPMRDCVAFCGPGNLGHLKDDGFLGHAWLRLRGNLVDFSVGDWYDTSQAGLIREEWGPENKDPGRLVWTAPELPDFFWQDYDSLTKPWRKFKPDDPTTTPELGQAWYGPMAAPNGEREIYERVGMMQREVLTEIKETIGVIGCIKNNLRNFKLKERLAEANHNRWSNT